MRGSSILIEDLPPNVIGEKAITSKEEIRALSIENLIKNEISQLKSKNKKSDYYFE